MVLAGLISYTICRVRELSYLKLYTFLQFLYLMVRKIRKVVSMT